MDAEYLEQVKREVWLKSKYNRLLIDAIIDEISALGYEIYKPDMERE